MKIDQKTLQKMLDLVAEGYREHFDSGNELTLEDLGFSIPSMFSQCISNGAHTEAELSALEYKFCEMLAVGAERYVMRNRPGKELH